MENSQGTVTHWDPAEKKGADQMDDQRRVFLIFKEATLNRMLHNLYWDCRA